MGDKDLRDVEHQRGIQNGKQHVGKLNLKFLLSQPACLGCSGVTYPSADFDTDKNGGMKDRAVQCTFSGPK